MWRWIIRETLIYNMSPRMTSEERQQDEGYGFTSSGKEMKGQRRERDGCDK